MQGGLVHAKCSVVLASYLKSLFALSALLMHNVLPIIIAPVSAMISEEGDVEC